MLEQNVLRLQIAVDNLALLEENQGAKDLLGKAANDFERKAAERMRLDEFVEVHIEQLSGYAQMPAKVEALRKVDHAVPILRVLLHSVSLCQMECECRKSYPFAKLLQDIDFYQSLLVEALLVTDDFDGY